MRVISGKARGRNLLTREGEATRPTADYFKEVLFDCLQFSVPESRFLDLFSGSGAIAIEALSRGAAEAVLVEADREAQVFIRKNLENTGLGASARLLPMKAEEALALLKREGKRFDFIFMDPPYRKGFPEQILALSPEGLLAPDGVLIVEEAADADFAHPGWELVKEKHNKVTRLSFLQYTGEVTDSGN